MSDGEATARVRVGRARPADVSSGMARVTPDVLQRLGLREGDVASITAARRTAVIVHRLPFDDRGLELIRLDGVQRANAGAGIGDIVELAPVVAVAAERVVLAPVDAPADAAQATDTLRALLLHRVVIAGDMVAATPARVRSAGGPSAAGVQALGFHELRLRVIATEPRDIVRIAVDTHIEVRSEPADAVRRGAPVTYEDLGGLDDAIKQVREVVELPLRHPELFLRLGVDPPRGVLLHGPPGTGKTLLARAVSHEAEATFLYVGGPEIMGPYHGESEKHLREVFERAAAQAPAIIFLDEIDSIAPKRELVRGEIERRVVAQLLALMDGLEPRRGVIVIGATNLPDALDEALRRPGRFDREIAVGVPDARGRREVIAIHTRAMPLAPDVDLATLATATPGFVGADLAALAREAAMDALRRTLADAKVSAHALPAAGLEALRVEMRDFESALKRVQPSALREIMIQTPDVRWSDVGGLEDAQRTLREGIELPLRHPDAFRRLGIRAPRGFLLYGPPGTGKTLLAKAVAREAEANFISAKSADLLSKWYGESERQMARLFARARQVAPAIIFLDEIDALAPQRGDNAGEPAVTDRIVNTLLAELDGLEELRGVIVIGATNRPTLIDPALLRPGRLDELVYVPVPSREGRQHILRVHTARMPLAEDVDLESLASRTEGYTGADLEGLVRRAGLHALRADAESALVPMPCFERALADSRASVTPDIAREYEQIAEELKREGPMGRKRIGFQVAAEPSPSIAEPGR